MDSFINKNLHAAWLCIFLAIATGCSNKYAQEFDARLESVENMAATARLRADEANVKAELAAEVARQAQRTGNEANMRASQKVNRGSLSNVTNNKP